MVLVLFGAVSVRAEEIRPTFAMFADPVIQVPEPQTVIDPNLIPLWRAALARPEVEYQRLAAEAVARAHRLHWGDLQPARAELVQIVGSPTAHPIAVCAAAQALIALDSRPDAELLFRAAERGGMDERAVIEPALAAWDFQPIRAVWRERLAQPTVTRRRDCVLAANGCGAVRDSEALPTLLKIVHAAELTADLRLAGARAAGAIAHSGLEADASRLAAKPSASITQRLCAAALLARHSSPDALRRLDQLARDPEPAVAGAALGSLFETDPALVLPLVDLSLKSRDANVRDLAARALIALPAADRVDILAAVLDDPHPAVRGRVRDGLFIYAQQPALDVLVRPAAMGVLAKDGWRGQEQAALLLAALDHKPAAPRLVELLESPRSEVMVGAAWGMRKLAVVETLPAMLDKAERQTALRKQQNTAVDVAALDQQVAHLFEAMGLMHHAPAVPLLKQYVPKTIVLGESPRGAAVWALGKIFEGRPDEALAAQLMDRLRDIGGMPPEILLVRRMSAVTLGRMNAQSQLADLRAFLGPTVDLDESEFAQRWALRAMTGEELPLPTVESRRQGGWFLMPLATGGQ